MTDCDRRILFVSNSWIHFILLTIINNSFISVLYFIAFSVVKQVWCCSSVVSLYYHVILSAIESIVYNAAWRWNPKAWIKFILAETRILISVIIEQIWLYFNETFVLHRVLNLIAKLFLFTLKVELFFIKNATTYICLTVCKC